MVHEKILENFLHLPPKTLQDLCDRNSRQASHGAGQDHGTSQGLRSLIAAVDWANHQAFEVGDAVVAFTNWPLEQMDCVVLESS